MFLGTLAASLLRNLLTGKAIYRAGKHKVKIQGTKRSGEGNVRAGYGNNMDFLCRLIL